MIGDLVGKTVNPLVQLGRDRFDGQLFKTFNQRMGEAVQAITMLDDRISLYVIQYEPDLLRGVLAMIEKRNELYNRPLEINVVFPECVIGVDEQGLGAVLFAHASMINGSRLEPCV